MQRANRMNRKYDVKAEMINRMMNDISFSDNEKVVLNVILGGAPLSGEYSQSKLQMAFKTGLRYGELNEIVEGLASRGYLSDVDVSGEVIYAKHNLHMPHIDMIVQQARADKAAMVEERAIRKAIGERAKKVNPNYGTVAGISRW